MYKKFYRLERNPFGNSPDPRFLYRMPHTQEALASLEYGILSHKGFIVLTGEVGTGKTTLLRTAMEGFDPSRTHFSFLFNPSLDVLDLFEFILSDFGLVPAARNKGSMLIQLNRWLVERYSLGETCVLMIDEAQNLTPELLEEIRMLTNLETSSGKLLQIVLSGQPELEAMLRQQTLRQLVQRVAVWCRVQPLTRKQTAGYISARLKVAGRPAARIFRAEAVSLVHEFSGGIPRLINLICEHALILGYVGRLRRVTPEIVAAVARDLQLASTLEAQPG